MSHTSDGAIKALVCVCVCVCVYHGAGTPGGFGTLDVHKLAGLGGREGLEKLGGSTSQYYFPANGEKRQPM